MKRLEEEQEPWIQDLKQHWPDPGPAPTMTLPAGTTSARPVFGPAPALAAAALILIVAGISSWSPRSAPEPADWPAFNPNRMTSLRNRPRNPVMSSRTNEERSGSATPFLIRNRLRALNTQTTWRKPL